MSAPVRPPVRIVSGIQPSGRLHLGNYFGAVQQFLRLQDEAAPPLYFIADLHALTSVHDGAVLAARTLDLALDLLALGLDPKRAVLFVQSAVPEVTKLAWVLCAVTPVALLQRAHSYKDKVERGIAASTGLFTYPVLMAADILVYGGTRVPVGQDQAQHLELTRDMATKLNLAYVPGYDPAAPDAHALVTLPEALILEATAIVPGTDGRKMSKSYGNTIDLFAPDAELERQVMGMKTDSTPVAAPKPEASPLRALLAVVCDADEMREHERTWREGGVGYGAYKRRLLSRLQELFGDARRRRTELAGDVAAVRRIVAEGAERARAIARPVWARVAAAVGVEG